MVNINQFNDFIQKAQQSIMCGPKCQHDKKAELLKEKYLESKKNVLAAPLEVHQAEKNYVTFAKGELAYNELLEKQLHDKADVIAKTYSDQFKEETKKISSQIEGYAGILINVRNIFDLYTNYKKENIILEKKLKDGSSDILTNERKTFYEDQGIDNLNFYYFYFLLTIYVICVFCFIVFSFIYPSPFNVFVRIGITIAFIILPFISTGLLGLVLHFFNKIYNLFPTNMHLNV
jgi:hypothetical protein